MQTVEVDLGQPHLSIEGSLGAGGFGDVYLGFDRNLHRWLAIKVLKAAEGIELHQAFEAEARSHARLSRHEHVVTVHQAGFTVGDNRPWIAMEYAEGGTLLDHLERQDGGLPWDHAVEWLIPICDAVQAAHDQGILHRDIKPENILLETSGKPLLSDFGIACLTDDTEQSQFASIPHVAPEMFLGIPQTERSDVYSLGSTLYLLLTRRPPFGRKPEERHANLQHRRAPELDDIGGPEWVVQLLLRALAHDPADRYPSAAEMRRSLRAGLGDRQVVLPTIPRTEWTPPGGPLRKARPGDRPPVQVNDPAQLRAVGAGLTWAPSTVFDPRAAQGRRRLGTWSTLNRTTKVGVGAAALTAAIFSVSQLNLFDGRIGPDTADDPPSSLTTEPTTPASGDTGGEPTADRLSTQDGSVGDPSLAERLDLANLPAVVGSAPLDTASGSAAETSELIADSVIGAIGADPAAHGLATVSRNRFSYPGHRLESMLLLFADEEGASAYLAEALDATALLPHQPGAPRDENLDLVTSSDSTIIAFSRSGTVVGALAVTTSDGSALDTDSERFQLVTYGTLLRTRLVDLMAGQVPVAAWLAVSRVTPPFDDPAVVDALEAAMDDELALEVLGGRIAVAAFDGVASVDLGDLRANMVPDQVHRPEETAPLLAIEPITSDQRWWCDQPMMEFSVSCDGIFLESGQQLGGEQGIQIFEILAQEQMVDAGVLVAEFLRDVGLELDVPVIQLTDADFGIRLLNAYYEALMIPAS